MTQAAPADDAVAAFEVLRAEVALLRRGIEGLTAERTATPDYGPTIEQLVMRQDAVAAALRAILACPAVQITPEAFTDRLTAASQKARQEDRASLHAARQALERNAQSLAAILALRQSQAEERLLRTYVGSGCFFLGMAVALGLLILLQ